MLVCSRSFAEPPESAASSESKLSYDVEVAGAVVYTTPPIRGGTTPFGAGLGVRGGVAFPHLYVGLAGRGYLGGSDGDITDNALLGGVELGYGVSTPLVDGELTLRPLLGVGGMLLMHTDPSLLTASPDVVSSASGRGGGRGGQSDTTTLENVYLEPALLVMYGRGSVFGAAEANLLVIPGVSYSGDTTTWLAYGIQGEVGYRF
jgi:hypothetical protein